MFALFTPQTEEAQPRIASQRMVWVNLIYPRLAEEPAIAGIGWKITTT
jgi:hypothetical protein